jgi:hypothetical protein
VHAYGVQRLVAEHVADTGEHPLVEEGRTDRPPVAGERPEGRGPVSM